MKNLLVFLMLCFSRVVIAENGIPVLEFHKIEDTANGSDTIISIQNFDADMKWLHDNGYTTISASQLAEYMADPNTLQVKADVKLIVITFDDGWLNQLNAIPILKKYGFTATFNIIASAPGTAEYMTWEQISKLSSDGFDIGSHSMTHKERMDPQIMRTEIVDSKAVIESHIGAEVRTIAWPNGYFSKDMQLLASTVYEGAQTIDQSWCYVNNTSIDGQLACQYVTGNSAFQNPMLMKRMYVDGSYSADEFGAAVLKGYTSKIRDNQSTK